MAHDGYYSIWDSNAKNGMGGWVFHYHDEETEHQALVNDFNAGLKSDPHAH